jgi:hypothetical protein
MTLLSGSLLHRLGGGEGLEMRGPTTVHRRMVILAVGALLMPGITTVTDIAFLLELSATNQEVMMLPNWVNLTFGHGHRQTL